MTVRTRVEFWFDPMCPWAWMTSRWLMEVEALRPIDVTWAQMSLSALNEGRDLPRDYRDFLDRALRPARVVAAATASHGQGIVKPLYDALGTRFHPGGRTDLDAVIAEALAEVGLPAALAAEVDNPAWDDGLRAAQARVVDLVGDDVGTPVISIDGVAFFGPVVTPAPTGEAAARLFDGCVLVAGTPGFFELKRSRSAGPQF